MKPITGRNSVFIIKPGSHIPPTYLRRSRPLQLTTLGDLSQWVPGASAMDRRRTQICAKCKSNWLNFQHFTCKCGLNRLTGIRCVRRWCSHDKIFSWVTIADNRRLACEVELSPTSQASRRSVPRKDYDSVINVHICRNGVPDRAGGYVQGMSAPYENQAFVKQRKRYKAKLFKMTTSTKEF